MVFLVIFSNNFFFIWFYWEYRNGLNLPLLNSVTGSQFVKDSKLPHHSSWILFCSFKMSFFPLLTNDYSKSFRKKDWKGWSIGWRFISMLPGQITRCGTFCIHFFAVFITSPIYLIPIQTYRCSPYAISYISSNLSWHKDAIVKARKQWNLLSHKFSGFYLYLGN